MLRHVESQQRPERQVVALWGQREALATRSTDCLNGVDGLAHVLRGAGTADHGDDELVVVGGRAAAGEELEQRGVGGGGVAEPGTARDPLEEGESGGRVERGHRGAEEVGHVRGGHEGGQALVGSALVPAARGDDAAELRDDVRGGRGGGGGGGGGGAERGAWWRPHWFCGGAVAGGTSWGLAARRHGGGGRGEAVLLAAPKPQGVAA